MILENIFSLYRNKLYIIFKGYNNSSQINYFIAL